MNGAVTTRNKNKEKGKKNDKHLQEELKMAIPFSRYDGSDV